MRGIDLTGEKFGKWNVLRKSKPSSGHTMWSCICECGRLSDIYSRHLRTGKSKGCLMCAISTHGMSKYPEWIVWMAMRSRCLNKNHVAYKQYGGRGITICDRWVDSFENFYEDMGFRPEKHSLDRIDNSKGYSKDNCKWSSCKDQSNNMSSNKIVIYKGEEFTVAVLAEKLGIKYQTLYSRLRRGSQIGASFL